ncbi:MAG: hypothetical protein ACRCZI_13335, partial [Cetobacterium sp.]
MVIIGSQQGDSNKAVTLRKWLTTNAVFPEICLVKVVFRPSTWSSFSMVTEQNFRVSVKQDSNLEKALLQDLESWVDTGRVLGIKITDVDRSAWD